MTYQAPTSVIGGIMWNTSEHASISAGTPAAASAGGASNTRPSVATTSTISVVTVATIRLLGKWAP